MAATPILFTSVVPTIDLAKNLSPKYITLQSPQDYRVVQYHILPFVPFSIIFISGVSALKSSKSFFFEGFCEGL
jgi:hypothetical protein